MNSTGNHNIPESDLIKECIAGNRVMQKELYNRYASKMYAVCMRYTSNTVDAQDLLQEGFIKVFRNIEKFRGEGSFEGWIRRIFINTSIEHFRRKNTLFTISEKEEKVVETSNVNALDNLAEKDIIQLIQDLSPGYRTVFNMYAIEGFSHKEISQMLGISEGTSKSQLARAKAILQRKINDHLDENRKSASR